MPELLRRQNLRSDGQRHKRPIKDVRLGDWVLAQNPVSGEKRPQQVIRLIRHAGMHTTVALGLADGSTVDATDHHPAWVSSQCAWVDAIDLTVASSVETADGRQIAVASVEIRAEDLTGVQPDHREYAHVLCRERRLVHNAG